MMRDENCMNEKHSNSDTEARMTFGEAYDVVMLSKMLDKRVLMLKYEQAQTHNVTIKMLANHIAPHTEALRNRGAMAQ